MTNTVADFVRKDHPFSLMRELIDEAVLSPDHLSDEIYTDMGKGSIAILKIASTTGFESVP